MFILKFLAKILVLPIIFALTVILAIYSAVDSVLSFFVGAINIFYIIGIIAALIDEPSFYFVKQALIFFSLETALLAIPQICGACLDKLHTKLLEFVWA